MDETTFRSGDIVSWTVSDLASPGIATALEYAKGCLYTVVMSNTHGTQILCNRVAEAMANASFELRKGNFCIAHNFLASQVRRLITILQYTSAYHLSEGLLFRRPLHLLDR